MGIEEKFKYLGVDFHKSGNMSHADRQWGRALLGACHNVTSKAAQHGLSHRIDISLQLFQCYAVSAGLYAAQVWSTPMLHADKVFKSHVQMHHLNYIRRLIGVRKGTCRWSLLHELGQKPYHFYWWRMTIKFWNECIRKCNSDLFRAVLKSDAMLCTAQCKKSWSWQLCTALNSLPDADHPESMLCVEQLKSCATIDWACVQDRLLKLYGQFWSDFDSVPNHRIPDVEHRKSCTYAKCFRRPEVFPTIHPVYKGSLPRLDIRRIARFRLGSHNLAVETARHHGDDQPVAWADRVCTRCSPARLAELRGSRSPHATIDDEWHLVFKCQCMDADRASLPHDLINQANLRKFVEADDFQVVNQFIAKCMLTVDDVSGQHRATSRAAN